MQVDSNGCLLQMCLTVCVKVDSNGCLLQMCLTVCVKVDSNGCLLQTLAQKARAGKLKPQEFQGGTFRSVKVTPHSTLPLTPMQHQSPFPGVMLPSLRASLYHGPLIMVITIVTLMQHNIG